MQMRKEDNRMSVYVIAQGKIENRGLIDQYVAKVIPTIESHQGRHSIRSFRRLSARASA